MWRRTHDLGGTDWDLVLPLSREGARLLHGEGFLSVEGDALSDTLNPGIIVLIDAVEARTALCRPESAFARAAMPTLDMSEEQTPKALADLWLSSPPGD